MCIAAPVRFAGEAGTVFALAINKQVVSANDQTFKEVFACLSHSRRGGGDDGGQAVSL
jgi:hypothetical protein